MRSAKHAARIATFAFAAFGISTFIQIAATDPALARSTRFCEDYAHGYADRRTGNVLHSTARGAGAGAIFGGIIDGRSGARRGAAIGAGAGLVGGSARTHSQYNRYFNRAFQRCMAMR